MKTMELKNDINNRMESERDLKTVCQMCGYSMCGLDVHFKGDERRYTVQGYRIRGRPLCRCLLRQHPAVVSVPDSRLVVAQQHGWGRINSDLSPIFPKKPTFSRH